MSNYSSSWMSFLFKKRNLYLNFIQISLRLFAIKSQIDCIIEYSLDKTLELVTFKPVGKNYLRPAGSIFSISWCPWVTMAEEFLFPKVANQIHCQHHRWPILFLQSKLCLARKLFSFQRSQLHLQFPKGVYQNREFWCW